jgi:hypothetical protein
MLVCALFVHIAHETAGAARTRSSLRPLIGEGKEISGKARAERAARSRSCVLDRDAPHIHNRHSGMRHLAQARNPSRGRVGGSMDSGLSPSGCPGMTRGYRCSRSAPARHPQTKTRQVAPPRSKSLQRKVKPPYSSSSAFLPPIVFSFANTASTLRSSRCFSVGSNSGSFLVVSDAGSRVAPP